MILFSCPGCHKVAEASEALAGSVVTCPDCKMQMAVPAALPAPATPGPFITSAPPLGLAAPSAHQDGKVRFLCPACKKRLRAPRIAVGTITVCRRCDQRIEVPAPGQPGPAQPPPLPAGGAIRRGRLASEYYYVKDSQRCGPVNARRLKELAEAGQLAPTDLIWKRGMAQWTSAVCLKGLFPGVQPPPLPTEPPPLPAASPPRAPATPISATASIPMPATRVPAANATPTRGRTPATPPRSPAVPAQPAGARPSSSSGPVPVVPTAIPAGPARTPAASLAVPDVDRTLSAWTETLRLDPKNVSVRINRAMAYAEKGDYDRAIGDLTEALRLEPRSAQAYASRGVIHAQMRADYAKGIADLTRAVQAAPDEVILYEFRAVFYRAVGDSARAGEDEKKAAELRPRGTLSNIRLGPASIGK